MGWWETRVLGTPGIFKSFQIIPNAIQWRNTIIFTQVLNTEYIINWQRFKILWLWPLCLVQACPYFSQLVPSPFLFSITLNDSLSPNFIDSLQIMDWILVWGLQKRSASIVCFSTSQSDFGYFQINKYLRTRLFLWISNLMSCNMVTRYLGVFGMLALARRF